MIVTARLLTAPAYVAACGRFTARKSESVKALSDLRAYIESEHSPIRVLMLEINMLEIPAYSVSIHFARHKIGVEHFVTSNRPDRAKKERTIVDKVNHRMVLNYQALRNIARERLCSNAAKETQAVMIDIVKAVRNCDEEYGPTLADCLVPKCKYRGGTCHEPKSCGRYPKN